MIIPVGSIHSSLGSIEFHSWRLFIAVSALPSILGALLYFILPESPRFLLEVGKERKAVKVLERVYKINHLFRKNVPEFPVSSPTPLSVYCAFSCPVERVNKQWLVILYKSRRLSVYIRGGSRGGSMGSNEPPFLTSCLVLSLYSSVKSRLHRTPHAFS